MKAFSPFVPLLYSTCFWKIHAVFPQDLFGYFVNSTKIRVYWSVKIRTNKEVRNGFLPRTAGFRIKPRREVAYLGKGEFFERWKNIKF